MADSRQAHLRFTIRDYSLRIKSYGFEKLFKMLQESVKPWIGRIQPLKKG